MMVHRSGTDYSTSCETVAVLVVVRHERKLFRLWRELTSEARSGKPRNCDARTVTTEATNIILFLSTAEHPQNTPAWIPIIHQSVGRIAHATCPRFTSTRANDLQTIYKPRTTISKIFRFFFLPHPLPPLRLQPIFSREIHQVGHREDHNTDRHSDERDRR